MSNTILVTTDLSANSKAGIRFAVQLASKNKSSLVFFHCLELSKPTRWSESKYQAYRKDELETAQEKLIRFVNNVLEQSGARKQKFECVVQPGSDPQRAIINYAGQIKAEAICMSTRGAGRLRKVIGTTASGLLAASPVPVFVIPATYRRAPISTIFYASDLNDLRTELKQVQRIATPLRAKVAVFHYDYLYAVKETKQKLAKIAERFKASGVKFVFQKLNLEQPLVQHLSRDFKKSKASLAVLFTNQKRGWFDKLFLSSNAADVSYSSKIPLLIIPKQ